MSFLNLNPYWLVVDRRGEIYKILPCRYTPTSTSTTKRESRSE
jgi:hypothetical protein